MLEVEGIDVGYQGVRVLHELSLRVDRHEMVAVLGSNGVGKTTLLRAISGLLRASRGRIAFQGRSIASARPDRIVEAGLVQVPEGKRLFTGLSVLDNLLVGNTARHARPRRSELLAHVFAMFPRLAERRHQAAGTLSGGEQQMVAIARALMGAPDLLMLDEPSLGLAPVVTEELFATLRRLNREALTIVVVEQNVSLALQTCHRGYVIEGGRVALADSAEALMADDRIRRAYLGL